MVKGDRPRSVSKAAGGRPYAASRAESKEIDYYYDNEV